MVHGSAEETAPPQHPQGQFEQLAQLKFAMDAQLLDPHVLTLAFRFYNLLCDVCVRIARGSAAGPAEYVPGHRRCSWARGNGHSCECAALVWQRTPS